MDKQAISMVGTFQPTRLTRLSLAHLTSASKAKIYKLRNLIILFGLALGIAIVLGLDFIKTPLRHEKDIQSAVQIPIIGTLPQIKK